MDLFSEISQSKFVMVLLDERQYFQELIKIVKRVSKEHEKICYVCLAKTYTDVVDEFKHINLDAKKFYFLDVLSSHYKKPKTEDNCMFLDGPADLTAIRVAISKIVKDKKASVVIFDTISALMVYQEASSIVRMTHDLMTEKVHENSNTVFVVLKGQDKVVEDLNKGLISDLEMFADKTVDLGGKAKNG